ncbi:TetR/AcrR family transcriptional regulator [Jatrophihabitans fulvus]
MDAAGELFYAEGIHTVGIDRVIERAGVAKASLYNTFGSKDELVRAYLQQRHARTQARVEAALERWNTPRDKLIGIFVSQGERMREPDYCGCPFVAATAESPADSPARAATADYRAWIHGLFAGLAAEAGVADPDGLARQLVMVYDGAGVAFRADGDAAASDIARASATALVDAALPR